MNRGAWDIQFSVARHGEHGWILRARVPRHVDLYLKGADRAIEWPDVDSVRVQWNVDGAQVELRRGAASQLVHARAAWAHEPRPDVYAQVPLAPLTPSARRFWTRVFRAARIPGAIWVIRRLSALSRRSKGRTSATGDS